MLTDIPERKEADEELLRVTLFQRTILNSAAYSIISATPEGIVTSFNPAAERLLGYSAEEIVGKQTPAIWHDPQEVAQHARRLSEELGVPIAPGFEVFIARPKRGLPEEKEWTLIRKDGARVAVSLSVTALRSEDGRIMGFVGLIYDLTERKQSEQALLTSERRMVRVLANIPGFAYAFRVTPDGHSSFPYASPGIGILYGLSPEDVSDDMMPVLMLVHPDDRARILAGIDESARGLTPFCIDFRICRPGLPDRWVEARSLPEREADGSTLWYGIMLDITERKHAEKSLTEYAAIIESTDDAIIGKSLDGIITSWNRGAERMLGYGADEIIGHSIAVLVPEGCESEELDIQEKIGRGESVTHYETVRRCKDGHLIDVSITVSPLRNPQGEIVGASKIARDITEHKRAEDELRRYRNQLEETVERRTAELLLTRDAANAANKAKSVFLANMSHELRTPLNAILGFSGLLRGDSQLTDNQRKNVDIINRSGEHLLTLINDVLEIAKIEAGRLQLEIAPFDLGSLVRDVVDMMQVRALEKGLRLQLDQSSEFPRFIEGDEVRLRQILVNLIGNAVKFTEQGGVVVRLGVKENGGRQLLIEVEDTGPGISPEDQQRVFQPFVQLVESGEQKGTGLGLTISRQFVQMMGGTIGVDSTLGKGTRFHVELPVKLAGTADILQPERRSRGEVVGLAAGQPRYRILIAEDQRDNQLLLSRLMANLGLEVRIAENGEQCVRIFQEWHPDLIWMDRRMPVMDGMEATRHIRRLADGGQVKIVAVTASAFKEQQQEILDVGMNDFVRKPYRFDEIYDCLARQLGVRYLYHADDAEVASPVALESEMLEALPAALRQELTGALEELDMQRIAEALRQVSAFDGDLGKMLTHLADGFDYMTIVHALKESE